MMNHHHQQQQQQQQQVQVQPQQLQLQILPPQQIKMEEEKKKPNLIFHCKLCNKNFARSDCLRRHNLMFHEVIKPYSCDVCSKAFARMDILNRHKWIKITFLVAKHYNLRPNKSYLTSCYKELINGRIYIIFSDLLTNSNFGYTYVSYSSVFEKGGMLKCLKPL